MEGVVLCQGLYNGVGINAENHPLRNSARASRMISGSRSSFPDRRSCSASAESSRHRRSFSTINKTRCSSSRFSSSMVSLRLMISGRSFFGANTVEFMFLVCRLLPGKASHLSFWLRSDESQQLRPGGHHGDANLTAAQRPENRNAEATRWHFCACVQPTHRSRAWRCSAGADHQISKQERTPMNREQAERTEFSFSVSSVSSCSKRPTEDSCSPPAARRHARATLAQK